MDDRRIEESIRVAWQIDPPDDALDRILARVEQETTRRKWWSRTPRVNRWKLACAFAVLMLIALGFHSMIAPDQILAVTSTRGQVILASGQKLHRGDRVASGSVVRTGKDGRVTMVLRRGSLIHMDSNSELTMDRRGSVHITRGRLYCSNRMHELKSIAAPGGQIRLLGTVVDTEVIKPDATAITVVEGKVQLENSHGEAVVRSGNRAVLTDSTAPDGGAPVNTVAETSWYDGRNGIVSDSGEIVYVVNRPKLTASPKATLQEVWVMNADGSGKRRVATYVGHWNVVLVGWCPGSPWAIITTSSESFGSVDDSWAGTRLRMLNVATGQDMPVQIPDDYRVTFGRVALSPDCRYLAFTGVRGVRFEDREGGTWLYDLKSGDIRKILNMGAHDTPSWSPDGRYLIASVHEQDSDNSLVLVDTKNGKVQRLNLQGLRPTISPDGTRIAYIGKFPKTHTNSRAIWGTVIVTKLGTGGQPTQVSIEDHDARSLRWSPDGSRILYQARTDNSYHLYVAQADGSGVEAIYSGEGRLETSAWSKDGKTILARVEDPTYEPTLIAVAADGSGVANDLKANMEGSILPQEELEQSLDACDEVRKAEFLHQAGRQCVQEGRLKDAREYFNSSADILNELAWKYPLANLSNHDLTTYADIASNAASLSDSALLEICCRWRMRVLFVGRMKSAVPNRFNYPRFPAELPALWNDSGWWKRTVEDYGETWEGERMRLDMCPGSSRPNPVKYTYHQPNGHSKVGDIIIQCPNHPEHSIKLDATQLSQIKRQEEKDHNGRQ